MKVRSSAIGVPATRTGRAGSVSDRSLLRSLTLPARRATRSRVPRVAVLRLEEGRQQPVRLQVALPRQVYHTLSDREEPVPGQLPEALAELVQDVHPELVLEVGRVE